MSPSQMEETVGMWSQLNTFLLIFSLLNQFTVQRLEDTNLLPTKKKIWSLFTHPHVVSHP